MGSFYRQRRKETSKKQQAKAEEYWRELKDGNLTVTAFFGSDGELTKTYYRELMKLGPVGEVAMNLFRAQKCSDRAKVYRGGTGRASYSGMAYEKKNWSIQQLTEILGKYGASLGIDFGWRKDHSQEVHNWVLYVDLPTGQCSFHASAMGLGPAYKHPWKPHPVSVDVILAFCDQVHRGIDSDEMQPPDKPAPLERVEAVQNALVGTDTELNYAIANDDLKGR